jgi:hypothetical protein
MAMVNFTKVNTGIEKAVDPEDPSKPWAVYYEEVEEPEPEPENCPSCNEKVGGFMALTVCDNIKQRGGAAPPCDDLAKQVESGKLTAQQVVDTLRPYANKEDGLYLDDVIKTTLDANSGELFKEEPVSESAIDDTDLGDNETERRIMSVVSFFGSWPEVIDRDKLQRTSGVVKPNDLIELYRKGHIDSDDVLDAFISCARSDTLEGNEKREFFQNAKMIIDLSKDGDMKDAVRPVVNRMGPST